MDKWEQETLLSTFAEFQTAFLHLLLKLIQAVFKNKLIINKEFTEHPHRV